MKMTFFKKQVTTFVLLALAGNAFGEDWPMWRGDAERSAASLENLPNELYLQWVWELPELTPAWPENESLLFDTDYKPVVMGKTLFVGSPRIDSVTALDVESGVERWRYYTDGPVRFAPVAWNHKVYFTSDDGYVYCVDAAKGTLVWKFRGALTECRVIGNQRVVSAWPARGGPVLADGILYFAAGVWPFMGSSVYALDAETGKVVWHHDDSGSRSMMQAHGTGVGMTGLAPQGYLTVLGDSLLVPNSRSGAVRIDRKTGKLVWFWNQNKGDWYIPGFLDYFVQGSSVGGAICALAKAGARLYVDMEDQAVLALELASARRRPSIAWHAELPGKPVELLAAAGRLFVITREGHICCFGAKKVEPKTYPSATSVSAPTDEWTQQARRILKLTGQRECSNSEGKLVRTDYPVRKAAYDSLLALGENPEKPTLERLPTAEEVRDFREQHRAEVSQVSGAPQSAYHVVVQHAAGEVLEPASQGGLVLVRGHRVRHALHLVDLKNAVVQRTALLPEPIVDGATSPDGEWAAVATHRHVYRVELCSMEQKVLLEGVSGHLAFDGRGRFLAVLGHVPHVKPVALREPKSDEGEWRRMSKVPEWLTGLADPWSLWGHPAVFGVYDLEAAHWQKAVLTPIRRGFEIAFEGHTFTVFGVGGDVSSHVPRRVFRCHVQYKVETGEIEFGRGQEGPGHASPEQNESVGYQLPAAIRDRMEREHRAVEKLATIKDRICLGSDKVHSFAALERNGRVIVGVACWVGRSWKTATLCIDKGGTIRTGEPVDSWGPISIVRGRLVLAPVQPSDQRYLDVETGQVLFILPRGEGSEPPWHVLLPVGLLVRIADGRLALYTGGTGPEWTSELSFQGVKANALWPTLSSPDGRYIAIRQQDYRHSSWYYVLDAANGKLLSKVGASHDQHGLVAGRQVAFSSDGQRLGYLFEKTIYVHEVKSGQRLSHHPFDSEKVWWHLTPLERGFVASSSTGLSGAGVDLPQIKTSIHQAFRVQKITAAGREALIVEDRHGQLSLVCRRTGEVIGRWTGGPYLSSVPSPPPSPLAVPVYDGQALIRSVHYGNAFQIVDLRTMEVVVTVHPVPSTGEQIGWMAYTPDGWWDASPRTEEHLEVFRGKQRLAKDERNKRRNARLINQRLADIGS